MANLYTDENFRFSVVRELRALGHDVLRAQEAGQAGKGIPDPDVLAYAVSLGRAVLTSNRRHFVKLHKRTATHYGIIVCTDDKDFVALTDRIHRALLAESPLDDKLLRINKPSK